MSAPSSSPIESPIGSRSPAVLSRWIKVAAAIVALDLLLFHAGLFWRMTPTFGVGLQAANWHLVYSVARKVETAAASPGTALAIGSSIVLNGVDEPIVTGRLREDGVPVDLVRLVELGASFTDLALMTWSARGMRPWLVFYGLSVRDFPKHDAPDSAVVRTFYDSSIELPQLPRKTFDEQLDAYVRRYWKLYRYRYFARTALEENVLDLLPSVRSAIAAPFPPRLPPEALQRFQAGFINPRSFAAWEHWRETQRLEDYLAYMRANSATALAAYTTQREAGFGPAGNPNVETLRWMVRDLTRRGARVVLAYFPINPVFRQPGGEPYFDQSLAEEYAAVFRSAAQVPGARYIDLRNLLPAEDFLDMNHTNLVGMRKLSLRSVEIVEDEWRMKSRESGAQ